jgi:hypothetical protein
LFLDKVANWSPFYLTLLKERATDKAHMREIGRKVNKVVGIGERKWGGDFGRRMMMFESRVEIWE